MYTLISKFKCFNQEIIGNFVWASEAVAEAQRIGLPGEEFEVVNNNGIKVAKICVADTVINALTSDFLC